MRRILKNERGSRKALKGTETVTAPVVAACAGVSPRSLRLWKRNRCRAVETDLRNQEWGQTLRLGLIAHDKELRLPENVEVIS